MIFGDTFKQPPVSFLNEIILILQQNSCDLQAVAGKLSSAGGYDQRNGGSSAHPAITAFSPSLQFGYVLWIGLKKFTHGMIAEGIAGCPVVYILAYPAFKQLEIISGKLLSQGVTILAGNDRLFDDAGPPQFLA